MGINIPQYSCFFFFNDTATTEIYTLSLHDALPISRADDLQSTEYLRLNPNARIPTLVDGDVDWDRSEEHTSELQSHLNLVCRLLLEKKKNPRVCGLEQKTSQSPHSSIYLPSPQRRS